MNLEKYFKNLPIKIAKQQLKTFEKYLEQDQGVPFEVNQDKYFIKHLKARLAE